MIALSLLLLALASAAGLFLLALGLPGTWLLLAGILLAVGVHPAVNVTLGMVSVLVGLCVLAELLELGCTLFGAKRYGVSTPGVWGGIVGGIAGALALGSVIPIIGAISGAFLGTFLGAFGVELLRGATREQAMLLGWGAFVARMLAFAVKVSVAAGMATAGLFWLI